MTKHFETPVQERIDDAVQAERKLIAEWLLNQFVWEKYFDVLLLLSGKIERGEYRTKGAS